MLSRSLSLALFAVVVGWMQSADAHFLWVVAHPAERAGTVRVYFSEDASPDDPRLLERVAKAEAWALGRGRTGPHQLALEKQDDALVADLPATHAASPVVLRQTYGVISRGGETFLLNYYAKTYPSSLPGTWQPVEDAERLPFEIVPELDGRSVVLKVYWQGKQLPGGPKLTGLAVVAHGGTLYRLGGFTAENADDEEEKLISQAGVGRFDPQSKQWERLPDLPEPRSSFDAAVLDETLYVVGGWNMQPGRETQWLDTAWSLDLSSDTLKWKALPQPPFRRRAVALAAFDGRLYCLGGMREQGGPTTQVAVFDPPSQEWTAGAPLLGGPMDGFGASAFAVGERLYATTISGAVQRLSADQSQWEFIGQLAHPRFFHRLLPWQQDELVIVGGASMAVGKITELERLTPSRRVAAAD